MYLERYLLSQNLSTEVDSIGPSEIRSFILYLKQQGRLSDHSVNSYLRSVRTFWSWLIEEGFIADNPFYYLKLSIYCFILLIVLLLRTLIWCII